MTPSQAAQAAQTALDATNTILQYGIAGLALVSLVASILSIIAVIYAVRASTTSRKVDTDLTDKVISRFNSEIASLIGETKTAIIRQTESNDKRTEAAIRQTASSDHVADVTEQLGFNFKSYQAMTADSLEGLSTNILNVVNRFGMLDESIRTIERAVEKNPADHASVLDALRNLASAQEKIFNLIDSRLPASAKIDTSTPMRAPTLSPPPSNEALMLKRGTGEITPVKLEPDAYKPVKPEDTKPEK